MFNFVINSVHTLSSGRIVLSGELKLGFIAVGDVLNLSYKDGSTKNLTVKSLDVGRTPNVQIAKAVNRVGVEFEEVLDKADLVTAVKIDK